MVINRDIFRPIIEVHELEVVLCHGSTIPVEGNGDLGSGCSRVRRRVCFENCRVRRCGACRTDVLGHHSADDTEERETENE
jgi:hypothetical protein